MVDHRQGVMEVDVEKRAIGQVCEPVVVGQVSEASFRLLGGGHVGADAAIPCEGAVPIDQGPAGDRPPPGCAVDGEGNDKVAEGATIEQVLAESAVGFVVARNAGCHQKRVDGMRPNLRFGLAGSLLKSIGRVAIAVRRVAFPQPVAGLLFVVAQQQPDQLTLGREIELPQLVGDERAMLLEDAAQGRRRAGDEQGAQVEAVEATAGSEQAGGSQSRGKHHVAYGCDWHRGQDQAAAP